MVNYNDVVPYELISFFVTYSCDYFGSSLSSKGVFRKDEPLLHPLPLLMLQLGAVIITSQVLRQLLKPLKQPRFVSEMLTGILFGPTIFQYIDDGNFYSRLFMGKQAMITEVIELLGFTYFGFLIGVRTDLGMIKVTSKLAWAIGISIFILPVAITVPGAHIIGKNHKVEYMSFSLNTVSVLQSTMSFHVTSILLEDLNLLNSEIGRLALSSSLISNFCGLLFKSINNIRTNASFMKLSFEQILRNEGSRLAIVIVTVFVFRPIMFFMMKKIPEGKTIKEPHLIVLTVMLFGVALSAEWVGLQAYFGGMLLGLVVPAGPPLGSGLAHKLNLIVFALFMPIYILDTGRHVDFSIITATNYGFVGLISLLAYMGKIAAATLVPLRFFRMPFADAFSLGLILCSQGFFDVILYKRALTFMMIDNELFSILTITAIVFASIITPSISYLYDPSKRYANYRRRTIQHSRLDTELRILVCINEEEYVFNTINLLKASYSTRERPLGVYVLDLVELSGREHPLFINHQFHKHPSSNVTRTGRIMSAFKHFEQQQGTVKHQFFTANTPYSSMHDDICSLALEKSTSLLIFPFQKSESRGVRTFKKNVLEKAPCSVGILVDKRIFTYFISESIKESIFHVCVIFCGGPDSREALAYGMRMVEYTATRLTVIRLIAENEIIMDIMEDKLDQKVVTDMKSLCRDNNRIEYSEVSVQDGAETSRVLLSLDENYDFILVGRRVDKESSLVSGLTEWHNYIEELGILGDILASSDVKSNASVLVLQQQSIVEI